MKRVLSVVIVLAALGVAGLAGYRFILAPNRTIVRNSSGRTMQDVHLRIRAKNGDKTVTRDFPHLKPGEVATVRHDMTDSSVELTFIMEDKKHSHREPYVDLWTGEGWVLDVQPDGNVVSGYDYGKHSAPASGSQ